MRAAARWLFPASSARGRAVRRLRRPTLPRLLAGFAATHPEVFYVQIGSHNGQTGDPLQAHIDSSPGWRGLMVEPTPEHFASLTECRGGDPRFRLVRAAVTDHEERWR